MKITLNTVVEFDYTLTNGAGEVLDTSDGGEPLGYMQGHNNIIPGLEGEMEAKAAGDAFVANIPAKLAYGEHDARMVQEVPREQFEGIDNIEAGMSFQAQSDIGPVSVLVTGVTDTTVTVDGNHPLAGQDLTFDVKVVSVREATTQEIEHGHVHDGGHDH
jgi:FKBP-type peptidyl-prolyl cis-trans isomerase SlyD